MSSHESQPCPFCSTATHPLSFGYGGYGVGANEIVKLTEQQEAMRESMQAFADWLKEQQSE